MKCPIYILCGFLVASAGAETNKPAVGTVAPPAAEGSASVGTVIDARPGRRRGPDAMNQGMMDDMVRAFKQARKREVGEWDRQWFPKPIPAVHPLEKRYDLDEDGFMNRFESFRMLADRLRLLDEVQPIIVASSIEHRLDLDRDGLLSGREAQPIRERLSKADELPPDSN